MTEQLEVSNAYQRRVEKARQLLRSAIVYKRVLQWMGDPWGDHKVFATEKEMDRYSYDLFRPEYNFLQAEEVRLLKKKIQEKEIKDMRFLLKDIGVRMSVILEMQRECHFRFGEEEKRTLEENLGVRLPEKNKNRCPKSLVNKDKFAAFMQRLCPVFTIRERG